MLYTCLHACTHVDTHGCAHIYAHVYAHMPTSTSIPRSTNSSMHIVTHTSTQINVHVYKRVHSKMPRSQSTRLHRHVYGHVHRHVLRHVFWPVYVYIDVYTHVYSYVYTHSKHSGCTCVHMCTTMPKKLHDVAIWMCHYNSIIIRVRKYSRVAVNMAPESCRFGWAVTCPKTLIVALGDVSGSGNAKKSVNPILCSRCGVLFILRVANTYAYTVRCAGVHAQKCKSKALKFIVRWICLSPTMQNPTRKYHFLIKFLNPNSIRNEIYLGFCIVGLKVNPKDHFPWNWVLNSSAWLQSGHTNRK